MQISEIKSGMKGISVEASVVSISEPRTVNTKYGNTTRVADCVIEDASGSIKLSLWGDEIEKVKEGSKIVIENGYTTSFRGENRLNVGKYGKLRVIE